MKKYISNMYDEKCMNHFILTVMSILYILQHILTTEAQKADTFTFQLILINFQAHSDFSSQGKFGFFLGFTEEALQQMGSLHSEDLPLV